MLFNILFYLALAVATVSVAFVLGMVDNWLFPQKGGQPVKWSIIESLTNIVVGYGVALASQLIIFPILGIHIPFSYNLYIGGFMTLVSVIRSFALRRYFNWLHVQGFYTKDLKA